ncbi:hypothetical protein B0T37_22015 [Chromobacterium violaceum]|uniref:LysM peptidoglycan-binding domain-containing protein n=1 Tax=Chromobacterium violaceum TaxID=536 RepID=UPI0009DB1AF1|nr:LysM peptidoglycan-binding domain-containing protein [Chromobacterium violaceum]OQS08061.1 hypothetical protein B0T38_22035 [Chromobacterium violaceum]OQS19904.1 hypothetical protein B0T37_22015 [Chromobacterium violaceum]
MEAEGQPEQRTTRYGYDAGNRLVSQTGDAVKIYTLDKGEATVSPSETRRYDAAGNLVEFVDANGNVTRSAYDSQNRKVRERNGDGYVTTWAYDGAGNVIEQRVYATAVGLPADGSAPQPADGNCRVTKFEYDNNNRLKRTITPSQNIDVIYRGENGNPGFQSVADLAVSKGYDANGNTVRETDARGNSVYRWFDRAGRKLLEVDAAGYATAWAYNSVGKPVRETRYAAVLSGINSQTTLDQARQQLKPGNDDRVSEFDYDRMGRVSEERRLNVKVSIDDGQSDGLNTVRTQYLYNALGQVRQQIDAKGGIADIDYDSLGRETKRREAAYGADQGGLRPEARTYYNALGQSVKVERNNLNRPFLSSEYGAGGRLLSQTDAEGNVIRYQYDAAGNLTRTLRDRQSPDGTTATDETRFAYSAAKLQIARLDAGSGLWLETAYNAWGQITGKRTSPDRGGAWQEFSEYDGLGRLVKGNAGGVTKLYGYDANGNAMLTVESGDDGGDALRGMTMAGLRAIIEQRANSNAPLDTLRLTMSDYDARNQRTATYQPVMVKVRDLGLARVMPWFGAQTAQGSDSVVKVGPVGKSGGVLPNNPLGGVMEFTLPFSGGLTIRPFVDAWNNETLEGNGFDGWLMGFYVKANLPVLNGYGAGQFQVEIVNLNKPSKEIRSGRVSFDPGSNGAEKLIDSGVLEQIYFGVPRYPKDYSGCRIAVNVYKVLPNGQTINIYSSEAVIPSGPLGGVSTSVTVKNTSRLLHFKDQPSDVNRLLLLVRGKGTNEGWRVMNVPRFSGNWFALDWSGMARGEYEFRCLGYNGDGQLKSARQGTMRLDDSGAPPQLSNDPMPKAFMYGPGQGLMNVAGLGDGVTQGRIRFRVPGGDWNDERDVNMATSGGPLKGWLQFDPAAMGLAAGQRYEYKLRGLGGETVIGSFIPNDPNSVSEPQRWLDQPQTVRLFNQPAGVTSGKVLYRRAGSNDARQEAALVYDPVEGSYVWNCADLAGRLSQPTDFEVECQLYGSAGQLLNLVGGTVRLGQQNEIQASLAGKSLPAKVTFAPSQLDGVKMELRYHLKGSQSDTDWQNVILTRGAQGFEFNVDGLAVGDYEYRYQLRNAAGQLLNGADGQPLSVSGYLRRGAPGERDRTGDMEWVFIGINNPNATITRSQHYNAFGEVDSETDGIGNTSRYVYSAAGKLLSKQDPQVSITLENGQKQTVSPLTQYRYDAMGNTVATIDANGKTNRQRWLAGSQNGQGKVTDEWHADGGVKTMKYDAQGNLASSQDEIKRLTRYSYDNLGQLKRVDRAGGGYDEYDYDSAGQRIRHRATSTGSDVFTDTTRYDSLGRVRETVSAAGRHLNYDYRWDAQLKGAGGTVVGGWRCVTRNDNLGNNWQEDAVNLFGQKVEHTDLGGRVIAYDYNNAGQLRWQHGVKNSAQNIVYRYYGNGYLMSLEDSAIDSYTLYEYDKEGRKTFEGYRSIRAKDTYQYAEVQYDVLGRVTQIQDPKFLTRYEYDAVGNRRRIYAEYRDPVDGSQQTQDNWYTYDEMNRLIISMGRLDNGVITRGSGAASTGVQIAYDLAGQRKVVINANNGATETYAYTDNGYLKDTWLNGKLAAHRENDLLGRATEYRDYRWDGDGGQKSKTVTEYDRDNKVLSQVQDDKSRTAFKMYNDGTLEHTEQKDGDTTTTTYYTYEWWDEAKQSTITAKPYNPNAPGWKDGTSHLKYDANGHLAEAIDEVANRSLRYVSNAQGLVLRREELNKGSTYKKQDYYYLDGKQVGAAGNDGLVRVNYAQALAQINLGNRKDEYRHGYQVSSADFDQNYEPIGPNYPAQAPGTVTARDGDTLQVIAANLWGDKSLWYLLADANGLTGTETLKAGQVLRVPNKVTNLHNNSGTYRVYNPGEAIGDVTPTLPEPPPPPPPPSGGGGCGGIGAIFVAVVAVVAVVMTAGAAAVAITAAANGVGFSAAMGMAASTLGAASATLSGIGMAALGSATWTGLAAAAIGGAVGSIVSQGAAMAMGMQDKFSWGQVGLSAFTTAATAGLAGGAGGSVFAGKEVGATVARTMAVNAATQGVAMATGLQKSFSWTSVAASGVAAWATSGIKPNVETDPLANIGYGTLRGMAGGTIQSVLGNDHQPNWSSLAASSFGSVLGDVLTTEQVRQSVLAENDQGLVAKASPYAVVGDSGEDLTYGGGSNDKNMGYGGVRLARAQRMQAGPGAIDISEPVAGYVNGQWVDEAHPTQVTATRLERSWLQKGIDWVQDKIDWTMSAVEGFAHGVVGIAQGVQSLATDQIYVAGYALTLGRMDDRGALARNRAVVENLPKIPGQIAAQFNDVMYYGVHPRERSAYDWGKAVADVAPIFVPALRVGRIGALSASVGGRMLMADSLEAMGPTVDRMAWKYLPAARPASIMPDAPLAPGLKRTVGDVPNSGLSLHHTGGGGYADAADELYAGIRASGTDVSAISQNTGIKPENIQKVKDHVFYNEHLLDRYVDYGIDPVRARFDSDLNQAQAWQRLEGGTHTEADIMWLRHEAAERWYELRHNSGYTAAHNAAERKWSGNPWGDQ